MISKKSYFKISGGQALTGEVDVSGSKNAILPLLFASLLCEGDHEFKNVPDLKDVHLALDILSSLGVSYKKEETRLWIQKSHLTNAQPCSKSAKAFRASVLCLGPLLSRFGSVKVPLPGGCNIGERPIDLHLKALRQLGADIFIEEGFIYGQAPKGLKACKIRLDFPSVGATENIIMACVLAKGTSRLQNIACEPEIEDLIKYLKGLGAKIKRKGLRELEIKGVLCLKPNSKPYTVLPDRIEAGTLLIAGACTKGEIRIKNCHPRHLSSLLEKLKIAGFFVETQDSEMTLKKGGPYKALHVKTGVYPHFPTDLQSQFMALMTQLEGLSSLEETVFENRFRYVEQLNHLKANIQINNNTKAFVKGPVLLKGHRVEATDLRAGAGLVLAALAAEGDSEVYGLSHIERGYDNLFLKLKLLEANIQLLENR